MTKFQLVLLMVFGAFIVIGVIFFSIGRSGGRQQVSNVSVWGFMAESEFAQVLEELELTNDATYNISYIQKDKDTFDEELVNALADGEAPDVVYINQNQILKQNKRLTNISYDLYPLRDFKNTFVEGTEVMLSDDGVRALPVLIDPLVLYWNRDIFNEQGVLEAPNNWASFKGELIFTFTQKNGLSVQRSTLPFGTWNNLTHSKEIVSALIAQAGGDITTRTANGIISALGNRTANGLMPSELALNFFVDFSNPQKDFYNWNNSLPDSIDFFASGRSAMYVGLASDNKYIKEKNPNLNFDIAELPQSAADGEKITFGNITSFALTNSATDVSGAVRFIYAMTTKEATLAQAKILGIAPARKDALNSADSSDAVQTTVFDSAKYARTWLDPDQQKTDKIFFDMINSVISGQKRIAESVLTANREMINLLK